MEIEIIERVTTYLSRVRDVVTSDHYFGGDIIGSVQTERVRGFPMRARVRVGRHIFAVNGTSDDDDDRVIAIARTEYRQAFRRRMAELDVARWRREKLALAAECQQRPGWRYSDGEGTAIGPDGRRYWFVRDMPPR